MKRDYLLHCNVGNNTNQVSIMLVVFLFMVSITGCDPFTEKPPVKPVAVLTQIEPTEKYPFASITRIEYEYGVLRVSEDWSSYSNVTNKRMFLEINTAWPDFGGRHYGKTAPINSVRLMFEINTHIPFKNIYLVMMRDKEEGRMEINKQDTRFNGLIGYKTKVENHFSYYQVVDANVTNVMATPIVIACTEDNHTGHDLISKQGRCFYNVIMDPALRIQIRFNKPHLKNFIALHEKVMQLIKSIRTVK